MRTTHALPHGTIELGRQGENLASQVRFDISAWRESFGDGAVQLIHQRSGDDAPYPAAVAAQGDVVFWDVTSADTAVAGRGKCELLYYVGDVLVKTEVWPTRTLPALDDAGEEPPEPYQSWVEQVLAVGTEASHEAEEAASAAARAELSAQDAEAYAVGKRGGVDVESGDVAYHNNAKYYAAQAEAAAADAEALLDTRAPVIVSSASGAVASFTDGADDMPVKDLTIGIKPVQSGSGDPTPTNVRPISGWTGATVKRYGTDETDNLLTVSIDWTSEAGTVYGGTLDVTTGVLTVTWAAVDLGTLNYAYNNTAYSYAYFYSGSISAKAPGSTQILASCYKAIDGNRAQLTANWTIAPVNTSNSKGVAIRDDDYSDIDTFKAAMSGQTLVFLRETPLTYQLTPQEVKTLLGTNNILADTGDTSVEYCADTKMYIDNKINAVMAAIAEL